MVRMGLPGRDERRRLCSPFLSSLFCVWAVGLVMFMRYLPSLFRDSPLALSMYMHSSFIFIFHSSFRARVLFLSFRDIDPRLPRRVRAASLHRFESSWS